MIYGIYEDGVAAVLGRRRLRKAKPGEIVLSPGFHDEDGFEFIYKDELGVIRKAKSATEIR